MKYIVNLQNYKTKGIHHRVIEAKNLDEAFDEARKLSDAYKYMIIHSITDLNEKEI